ncbi:MAG TPA: hypothetical protein VEA41_04560 [Salinarimonas sp.]|nr:hypothetical protein [Salinarimonas sp.]
MYIVLIAWREFTRGQRIMMVALGLYFISLFVPYKDNRGYFLRYATDTDFYTQMGKVPGTTSGWEAVPHAWVGLCILVGLFASDLCQHRMLRPWVFWAAAPALLLLASPSTAFGARGAGLAMFAVITALGAAISDWRSARVARR